MERCQLCFGLGKCGRCKGADKTERGETCRVCGGIGLCRRCNGSGKVPTGGGAPKDTR